MATRICRYCNTPKDHSEFVTSRSGRFGITWCCKSCQSIKGKRSYVYSTKPKRVSKWIYIKRIGVNGYKGAAVYKLSFDDGNLFYIGSTLNAASKVSKWQRNFQRGRINKRMKELIIDKSNATFEIVEKITDISILFDREEWHILQHKNNPMMLNRSLSARGEMIPAFDGDSWGRGGATPRKPVNKFRDGKLVNTYESIRAAASDVGTTSSMIWGCCFGVRKSIYGYTFSFVNDADKVVTKNSKPHPKRKKIYSFDMDGNFLKEYESITQAAKDLSIPDGQISAVISGNSNFAKGHLFSTTQIPPTYREISAERKIEIKENQRIKRGRRINQYSLSGEFITQYLCMAEASEKLNIPRTMIRKNIEGKQKKTHGFIFKRA